MNPNFTFCLLDNKNRKDGCFEWDKAGLKMLDAYYDASEFYDNGDIKKALAKYRYLVKKNPYCFPALSDLGFHFLEAFDCEKALGYFENAYNIAAAVIPAGFKGRIEWGFVENRHFLRVLQGLGLANYYLGNYEKSLEYYEKILKYNPNDNQGIRYLTGDAYFHLDKYKRAEKQFKENLDYPASLYSLGLLLTAQKRYVEAVLYFAKGIIADKFLFDIVARDTIEETTDFASAHAIRAAMDYKRYTISLWFFFPVGKMLLSIIFSTETFQLYYQQILQHRKKLEEIEGFTTEKINARRKQHERINELIRALDANEARRIYESIKPVLGI